MIRKPMLAAGLSTLFCLAAPEASAQEPDAFDTATVRGPRKPRAKDELERHPYHEGMRIPEGYHLEETPRYGLIATGVSITATLWLVSTISAISLDREASQDGDPNFDDMYWPMFIPVAGPFATIGTADSSGTGAAILALDGTIQAVGLAMAIAGFAAPTVEVVEDYEITVAPAASAKEGGISLSGSF